MFPKNLSQDAMRYLKTKKHAMLIAAVVVAATGALCYQAFAGFNVTGFLPVETRAEKLITEGPLITSTVTAGPFDLHRKYRSMEGPFVNFDIKIADLVASQNIQLPESMVDFTEDKGGAPGMTHKAPAMMGAKPDTDDYKVIKGVVAGDSKPALYWFKGVKLEVVDEQGKVMPTAEFICHWNLDIDQDLHNKMFPDAEPVNNSRLDSISQGETFQIIPHGYGFPVASNEVWHLSFQAANRTTTEHRRLKHRCTLYLLKDRDLVTPVQATYFFVPYITVVTDRNMPPLSVEQKLNCQRCFGISTGLDAPNDVAGGVFSDKKGRQHTGHWVIPAGVSTYHDVIGEERDAGFPGKGKMPSIVCAWTHVHPTCSSLSLYEVHSSGRRNLFTAHCDTKTDPGLQIMHLDFINPQEPIVLNPAGANYEMEITYNNTTGKPLDSMGSTGIFFTDYKFARPAWSRPDFVGKFCAMTPGAKSCDVQDKPDRGVYDYPVLNPKTLGPILTTAKQVEIKTTAGPIDIELNPTMAPKTATYFYRLFKDGVLNGTKLYDYNDGFNLGFAMPEDKVSSQPKLTAEKRKLIARIPLEVSPSVHNVDYMLSAGREGSDNNSGIGAFSILLGKAPQLDGKYCVFGKVITNAKTVATLSKIKDHWSPDQYFIVNSQPL